MKIGNPADKPAPATANGNTAELAKASEKAKAAEKANAGETAKVKTPAPAASAAKPEASAKIELSKATSTLLEGGSTPEFDAEKVARITQSISDGSFKINAEVIADKLISNAGELLDRARR